MRRGAGRGVAGFGETTQQKICDAIARRASHAGSFQFGQVAAEAEALRSDLAAHEAALQVEIAGSYRRRKEIVHDLDLLVATKEPEAVTKFFVSHPLVESVIAQGPTKSSVRLRSGVQCDLRVVTTAEYPFALAYFTGNKEHNIEMRSRALRGWTLNEYRLARFRFKWWVLPRDRSFRRRKKKPQQNSSVRTKRLVSRGRSRFHSAGATETARIRSGQQHSLPNSSRRKICAARFIAIPSQATVTNHSKKWQKPPRELGLEYLGIADHSRSSVQGYGIAAEKLLEQVAAIRKLNKTFDGFRLFAGVECDILRDGSLDFPTKVLIATRLRSSVSVHSAFQSERIRDDPSA
jgi:DNA polymerase (family 10)